MTPIETPPERKKLKKNDRKLNRSLIKTVVVTVAGAINALVSTLTGFGAHVSFSPMLTWMLGFNAEKAQASALNYAVFASAIGFFVTAMIQKNMGMLAGRGSLLFVGATVGAIAFRQFAPKPEDVNRRRLMQTLGLFLAIFVGRQIPLLSKLTESSIHFALYDQWWQLALIGVAVGAITQISGLVSGAVIFPAIWMLTGVTEKGILRGSNPYETVGVCLFVVFLASLLPAWGYYQKGIADRVYANASFAGALIGGVIGGVTLTNLMDKTIATLFTIFSMLLVGRELYRLFWNSLPTVAPTDKVDSDDPA